MARTLTTIRQSLLNRKKDLSDVSTTIFVEWCNYIADFAYDEVKATDPERFTDSDTTFTVSSSPQTSALPSDFSDISEWESGFYEIDSNGDTDRRLRRTGPGRSDPGYWISGTNVVFTGIDDSTQYRLRYHIERTEFSALADFFTLDALTTGAVLVPDGKLRYLVAALDVLYTIWDEEKGDESFADQRFVRQLNLMLSSVRKEPAAYGLNDFSQSF